MEEKITITWQTRMGLKPGTTLSVDAVALAGVLIASLRDIAVEIKLVTEIKNIARIEFWQSNGPYAELRANISTETFEAVKEIMVQKKQEEIDRIIEKLDKMGFVIEMDEGGEGK